jgi:hypothetical protein
MACESCSLFSANFEVKMTKRYQDITPEEQVLVDKIQETADLVGKLTNAINEIGPTDQRWVAIARTQMQLGFMALKRAVYRPDGF